MLHIARGVASACEMLQRVWVLMCVCMGVGVFVVVCVNHVFVALFVFFLWQQCWKASCVACVRVCATSTS